jgi:hypothetical protein
MMILMTLYRSKGINMEEEIRVYEKHKNLKIAANELGVKWQSLYVRLKKAGIAVTGDKERYGSDKDRLANKAESIFQSLVPNAISQNDIKFQSKVDFMVGDKKIDVKCSNLNKGMKNSPLKRWAFSVKKQEFIADFLVCFAFIGNVDSYKLLLIPGELIKKYQSISISENLNSKWLDYQIDPGEINDFFVELNEF